MVNSVDPLAIDNLADKMQQGSTSTILYFF